MDGEAKLTVLRDGAPQEVTVPLEATRLTAEEARRERNRDFELTVREVTFFDRDENRWSDDVAGVLVEQVEAAGWAGLGGLRAGDLIQRVDGQATSDIDAYRKVMAGIAERQPERVVFVVLRDVRTHFQYVEPDWVPTARKAEAEKGGEDK
jgi:serine protease Do